MRDKFTHVCPYLLAYLYEFNLINSDDPQQPFFSILFLKKLNFMALEFIGFGTGQIWECFISGE